MYKTDGEEAPKAHYETSLREEQKVQLRVVALQEAVKMYEMRKESKPVLDLAAINYEWLTRPFKL